MRKVTRKSLDELAKVMSVISEVNQKSYVGGTSGATGTTGYSGTTGITGVSDWTGVYDGDYTGYAGGNHGDGNRDSLDNSSGYNGTTGSTGVMGFDYGGTGSYTGNAYGDSGCLNHSGMVENTSNTENNPIYSNNGSSFDGAMDSGAAYSKDNPCSYNIYCIEADSGTWSGGYVQIEDESIYISKVTVNKIAGEGETYTFPEYIGSLRSDTMDRVLNQIATSIPFFGQVYDSIDEKYTNMTLDIQSELLQRGYTKDSVFFIKRTNMSGSLTGDVRFDVYDVSTGKIITSRTL